jgi:hypothetical protein
VCNIDMAKKSRRAHSRKVKHTKRRSTRRSTRRHTRRRGGQYAIQGAPLKYSLAGDWSSRMSEGQGDDFFKYHEGQHGGEAPVSSIGTVLDAQLRSAAHIGGIDKAFADIRGLTDQQGGKRKRRSSKRRSTKRKSLKRKSSKKAKRSHKRTHRRRRGGALGYAPVSAPGMLLSGAAAYQQAGLSPAWKNDIAFTDAKIRDTQ